MWVFYHTVVESGEVSLNIALGIPLLLVGIGLYVDTYLPEEAPHE